MPTAVAPAGTADRRVVADLEAAQHLGAGAHHHVAAQRRMALGALGQRGAAQRHALVDGAALADDGGLADHHAHAVIDEHPLGDGRARMDLDAGQPARELRHEAAQPAQVAHPEPVCEPVQDQRMQARIQGQDLPCAARRGVAVEDALDVGAEALEHGCRSWWIASLRLCF
jgi:hypothetical protein